MQILSPVPELYVSSDSAQKLKQDAADLPSWDLSPRQICDLELLMNGAFNPLVTSLPTRSFWLFVVSFQLDVQFRVFVVIRVQILLVLQMS